MRWPLPGQTKWALVSFVGLSAVILGVFQNCGKAGFDSANGADELASLTSTNPRLASAPFPFDASFNEIAYMSCPMSGQTKARNPVELSNPFFTVRAGSYDNLSNAANFGDSNLTENDQSHRLQHGIGLSQSFIDYMNSNFKRDDPGILQNSIMTHPLTQDIQPVMAMIYQERSHDANGVAYDYAMNSGYMPMLTSLSDSVMANYLANEDLMTTYGTKKVGFFSSLDASQRAMVGSVSWGQSEIDRDTYLTHLASDLILTLGYMDTSTGSSPNDLISPDSDIVKSVYGRGYRLSFGQTSVDGLVSPKSTMLNGVEEYDLSVKPIKSISSKESESWNCFSLRIVRPPDTINPCSKLPFTNPGLYDSYPCTANVPGTPVIHGTRAACPPQSITSINATTTENGITYQKNMVRLNMARRMLPAEYWNINTDPNYMCAVPTDAALSLGACYASGDHDPSKYIQYNLNDQNIGGCGGTTGANECPAYVSICYRTY